MTEHSDRPVNYYEKLEKKYKEEELTYDNYNKVRIKLPFRMCVVGSTGSGKTNAVINLIEKINAFDKILLFAKDIEEPLYAQLIDKLRKAEKDTKLEILTVSTKIEDLPKLSTLNKKNNTLLIVDDMVTEKHKALAGVEEYWSRGRKVHVSSMYLSQAYFKIPQLIRQNSDYVILTKIKTNRDLHMILKEYQLGIDDDEMERLYREATKGGFPNYFLIDMAAGTGDQNEELRFRKNLTPLKHTTVTDVPEKKEEKKKDEEKPKPKGFPPAAPYVPGFAGPHSGSSRRSGSEPARSNGKLKPSHPLNVPIPPPPPEDASLAEIKAYVKELKIALRDDDVTMEQATEAMEDIPAKYGDYRDLLEEGDGFGMKKKRKKMAGGLQFKKQRASQYKKKRAKLSTETEKQLERMLGFRVRPYW